MFHPKRVWGSKFFKNNIKFAISDPENPRGRNFLKIENFRKNVDTYPGNTGSVILPSDSIFHSIFGSSNFRFGILIFASLWHLAFIFSSCSRDPRPFSHTSNIATFHSCVDFLFYAIPLSYQC